MLATLVKTQRRQLSALAHAWIKSGATAVELWQGEQLVARWSDGYGVHDAMLRVGIGENQAEPGEMRVYGVEGSSAQARIQADGALIEQFLLLEDDLQSMTAELVESQDQLIAMFQLSQSLRNQVSVEATLRSVVSETVRILRVRSGFGIVIQPDGTPLIVQDEEFPVDETFLWQTFWQGHASQREIMLTRDGTDNGLPAEVSNMLFMPIRISGEFNAGIGVFNKRGAEFASTDIKLIQAIAHHSSAHIENVILYQESVAQARLHMEVELAQRVQLQLLPQRVPRVKDLDIFAASRPASQVGGDFFDFVNRVNRPFIFTVGDVTGKGLSAALLMTMARTAIHSKASFMPNPTPEIVMRNSNEDLYDDFTQVGMFATAFIGQYDPAQRVVLYANAGHSPVIYQPLGGRARILKADSTPIGVLNISLCRNQVVPMQPGDLLIIATDGFTDVRNHDEEMFGYERLIELIELHAGRSAQQIADILFDSVSQFSSGRQQDDDQTLVVIKGV